MEGLEISKALFNLSKARSDEMRKRMKDYDETTYYPAMMALIDQCPHESKDYWQRNGVGWSWQECKWCGHQMKKAPTEEVGGEMREWL